MVYKWCAVLQCTNTTIKSPGKLFVTVPTNPKRRKMWLKLARRDPKSISPNSNIYMCEDHFDMEKDTINYMQYKMGYSKNLLLVKKAVPSKFYCQKDRKRRLSDPERLRKVERERACLNTECLQSQNATETQAESLQKDDSVTVRQINIEQDGGAGEDPHDAGSCDSCHRAITGLRLLCVQCEYSQCAACEAAGRHDHHYMLRVPRHHQQGVVQRIVKMIQMELSDVVSYEKTPDPNDEQEIIKNEIQTEVPEPLAEDTPSTEQLRPDILERTMLEIDINRARAPLNVSVVKEEFVSDEVVDRPPPLSPVVQLTTAASLHVPCPAPPPGCTSTSKRRSSSELQASAAKKSFITIHAGNISGVTVKTEPLAEEESLQTHEEASSSGEAGVTLQRIYLIPPQIETRRRIRRADHLRRK